MNRFDRSRERQSRFGPPQNGLLGETPSGYQGNVNMMTAMNDQSNMRRGTFGQGMMNMGRDGSGNRMSGLNQGMGLQSLGGSSDNFSGARGLMGNMPQQLQHLQQQQQQQQQQNQCFGNFGMQGNMQQASVPSLLSGQETPSQLTLVSNLLKNISNVAAASAANLNQGMQGGSQNNPTSLMPAGQLMDTDRSRGGSRFLGLGRGARNDRSHAGGVNRGFLTGPTGVLGQSPRFSNADRFDSSRRSSQVQGRQQQRYRGGSRPRRDHRDSSGRDDDRHHGWGIDRRGNHGGDRSRDSSCDSSQRSYDHRRDSANKQNMSEISHDDQKMRDAVLVTVEKPDFAEDVGIVVDNGGQEYDPASPTHEDDGTSGDCYGHGQNSQMDNGLEVTSGERPLGGSASKRKRHDLTVTIDESRRLVLRQDSSPPVKRSRSESGSHDELSSSAGSQRAKKYFCYLCTEEYKNIQDFDRHMNSSQHKQRMSSIMSLHSQKTEVQIARLKAEEHLRKIEQDKRADMCNVCDRNFTGPFTLHRRSPGHKRKERMTMRGCILCKTGSFDNYPAYVKHIDSDVHKKMKEDLNERLQKKTEADEAQEMAEAEAADEAQPDNVEDMVTMDAVGIYEDNQNVPEKSECVEEHAEAKPSPEPVVPLKLEHILDTASDEKDDELKEDEDELVETVDSVKESSENKPTSKEPSYHLPNKPVGQEFVVRVTGYFCKLCSKFYSSEVTAKVTHCKTEKHFQHFQENQKQQQKGGQASVSRAGQKSASGVSKSHVVRKLDDGPAFTGTKKETLSKAGAARKPGAGRGPGPTPARSVSESQIKANTTKKPAHRPASTPAPPSATQRSTRGLITSKAQPKSTPQFPTPAPPRVKKELPPPSGKTSTKQNRLSEKTSSLQNKSAKSSKPAVNDKSKSTQAQSDTGISGRPSVQASTKGNKPPVSSVKATTLTSSKVQNGKPNKMPKQSKSKTDAAQKPTEDVASNNKEETPVINAETTDLPVVSESAVESATSTEDNATSGQEETAEDDWEEYEEVEEVEEVIEIVDEEMEEDALSGSDDVIRQHEKGQGDSGLSSNELNSTAESDVFTTTAVAQTTLPGTCSETDTIKSEELLDNGSDAQEGSNSENSQDKVAAGGTPRRGRSRRGRAKY